MNTHVIKVGGENASNLETSGWLADFHNQWNQVAVAISALRTKPLNTTTELLKAKSIFDTEGMEAALAILKNLYTVHIETLQDAGMYDTELRNKLQLLFEQYFPENLAFPIPWGQYSQEWSQMDNLILSGSGMRLPTQSTKQSIHIAKEQRFIWYGEVMSAHILSHLLTTRYQVANTIIDHQLSDQNSTSRISDILRDEIGTRVHTAIDIGLVIVPGYISVMDHSIVEAYGRGYTDKTAERTAVGLANLWHTPILHIQKQVPMYSSHPVHIDDVRPLWDISYWTAAEITGSRGANAQVLNENTITRELTAHNIPIWVYNPFEPNAPKTTISQPWSSETGIQFIDSRDHVSTITISGFAMSWPGLLAQLTDLFVRQNISIDSISSSETEVTFTAYGEMNEEKKTTLSNILSGSLGDEYIVNIKNNLGLIYCIWDNLAGHPGLLEKITGTLAQADIDIECISQSRWQRAVTIGVSSSHLKQWVKTLHAKLIENRD